MVHAAAAQRAVHCQHGLRFHRLHYATGCSQPRRLRAVELDRGNGKCLTTIKIRSVAELCTAHVRLPDYHAVLHCTRRLLCEDQHTSAMLQSRGARHLARSWARWSAILAQDTTSTSQPWSSLVHGNQQQQKHGYRTIPTCQRSMLPRVPPIAAGVWHINSITTNKHFLPGQRRSMFIQTQTTPNPASLMFLPGQSVMGAEGGTKHFGSAREGMASPLAKRLFSVRAG